MIRIRPDTQSQNTPSDGVSGAAVPAISGLRWRRGGALGRSFELLLVPLTCATLLGACVELFPELEWEVESPFGGGSEDSTPGVVSTSSEAVPSNPIERNTGLDSPEETEQAVDGPILDEELLAAIAHATGESAASNPGGTTVAGQASTESGSPVLPIEQPDAGSRELGSPGSATEAPALFDVDSTVSPGSSGIDKLGEKTAPSAAAAVELDGQELAPGPESDPRPEFGHGAIPGALGGVPNNIPREPLEEGSSDAELMGPEDSEDLPADFPSELGESARAQPGLSTDRDSTTANSPANPPVGSKDLDGQSLQGQGLQGLDLINQGTPAEELGPGASYLTDLGFWFGRPVVSEANLRLGYVVDLEIDLTGLRVKHVDVCLENRAPFNAPLVVPILFESLEDRMPVGEKLVFKPMVQVAGPSTSGYSDLVLLAFEGGQPEKLVGTVTAVQEVELESGQKVMVVKLRDDVNRLHRLDLGPKTWFAGDQELPEQGQAFGVTAVSSREERGLIWRVATMKDRAGATIVLRDEMGHSQRDQSMAEPAPVVLHSAHSLLGSMVMPMPSISSEASSVDDQEHPKAIGAIAGLLLERERSTLSYALVRPADDSDLDAYCWLVPIDLLKESPLPTGEWSLAFPPDQVGSIPRLQEDSLIELDSEERRAEVQGFWDEHAAQGEPTPADGLSSDS